MDISDERDLVSIRIDKKLNTLSSSDASSKPSIYKVHEQLRKENEDAYEPAIVSIGPYHRGKGRLGAMESQKFHFFKQVLDRKKEGNADRYVTAMRKLEERARKCYADDIGGLNSDDFLEMLVLDSCFIVEVLSNRAAAIYEMRHYKVLIMRDLILFENQLPFFVVREFFNLSTLGSEDLIAMAWKFVDMCNRDLFGNINIHETINQESVNLPKNLESAKHLLDLYKKSWCVSFAGTGIETAGTGLETAGPWANVNLKSVTELRAFGVHFKQVARILLHVSFKKGKMEIPTLTVHDHTEAILRNLLVHEQYLPDTEPQYITDYMFLLDCLVNTPKDVKILRQCGIIESQLGDDVVIATLINKMCNNVITGKYFNYSLLSMEVNKHCDRKCNKWMAILRHTYFNPPWAFISFPALFLFLLTMVLTVFTILSYIGHA